MLLLETELFTKIHLSFFFEDSMVESTEYRACVLSVFLLMYVGGTGEFIIYLTKFRNQDYQRDVCLSDRGKGKEYPKFTGCRQRVVLYLVA